MSPRRLEDETLVDIIERMRQIKGGGRDKWLSAPAVDATRHRYRVLDDHGQALSGVYRDPLAARVWAAFLTRSTGHRYAAAWEGIDGYVYL